MPAQTFDPDAPLPGAPDPWRGSEIPAWRDGPPYVMTEMIAAEPALAGRVTNRLQSDPALAAVAEIIRAAARAGEPITTTGCGTSHHAAIAICSLVADALAAAGLPDDRVTAVQAFELSRRIPRGGVILAVSHEGGTEATNEALERANAVGATTMLVTVSDRCPAARLAPHVLCTGEQDQSWCHTVGYLSPVLAGACLHAAVGDARLDPATVQTQVAAGSDPAAAEAAATVLSATDRLLVVGSGADCAAARELALKIEEGARLPATAHELETIHHGHLAAADARTGLILFLTDGEGRGARLRERAVSVLRAAAALAMPVAVIAADDIPQPTAQAASSRLAVHLEPGLPRLVAAILGSAVPLQLLTERLARARGVNPDTLRREEVRHAEAARA